MKTRYHRFFAVLAFLLIALFMGFVVSSTCYAEDKQATFGWDMPPDYDTITHYVLYWGLATGGPYDTGQARIEKSDLAGGTTANITINYPPNAKTTYYYVLVAFRDDLFSANSNEVDLEVDFRQAPATPLNLTVTISDGS